MTALQTTPARGAVRPGASWSGWAGYVPTARGPEARRARAAAAGLIPTVAAPIPVTRINATQVIEITRTAPSPCGRRARPLPTRRVAPARVR